MRVSIKALLALAVWAGVTVADPSNTTCAQTQGDIYQFSLDELELEGETFSLEKYRGKVLMIFNSATY